MNKPLILTIAIGILLLAIASWLYLFLFGAPQSPEEVFTDLGVLPEGTPVTIVDTTDTNVSTTLVDVAVAGFQQLTARPVAGFSVLDGVVRYVEQGTGHLFDIDLTSGQETRISNTSVPNVTEAVLSPDGEAVVLIGGVPTEPVVTLGQRENGGLAITALPPTAADGTFTSTGTLAYTLSSRTETTGYRFDLATQQQQERFKVPFSSVHTSYVAGEVFVTNAPAVELEGASFAVSGTNIELDEEPAFGLATHYTTQWRLISYNQDNRLISEAVNRDTGTRTIFPIVMVPEKCVGLNADVYCAAPLEPVPYTYLTDWYQGRVRAVDALWRIIPGDGTAILLGAPEQAIGRPLDMTQLAITDSDGLFFVNRTDNTLWRYVSE
jgi:hypothetical protein